MVGQREGDGFSRFGKQNGSYHVAGLLHVGWLVGLRWEERQRMCPGGLGSRDEAV